MSWLDFDRYAVWGLGVSGVSAANLLARRGKAVVASDPGSRESLAKALAALHPDVRVELGGNVVDAAEVIVLSPGLKPSLSVFESVPEGVHLVSEIELAWAASQVPFVGITGTDGKSTTTTLIAHVLNECGIPALAAGNIGIPLCDVVDQARAGCIVAEVSAFQLWSTHEFHVPASALTNIAADHLDYFETWDEYVAAKRKMIANSGREDLVAFNWDDPTLRGWGFEFEGRRAWYSAIEKPEDADAFARAWVDDGAVFVERSDATRRVISTQALDDAGLRGPHNYSNFMAALLVAEQMGASLPEIADAATSFEPLAHRCQYVATISGVRYFDDSKATNVNAALAGIGSVDGELVVIAGGVDKGLPLDVFAKVLGERASFVILIGAIRARLAEELAQAGMDASRILVAETMESAVDLARQKAKPGESVMLSPACSSFDMFESYAQRGRIFQAAVKALAGDA